MGKSASIPFNFDHWPSLPALSMGNDEFWKSYLNRIARELIKMTSFRPIHFIQDGALKNIEHIEIISRLDHLMDQLDAFQVSTITYL